MLAVLAVPAVLAALAPGLARSRLALELLLVPPRARFVLSPSSWFSRGRLLPEGGNALAAAPRPLAAAPGLKALFGSGARLCHIPSGRHSTCQPSYSFH